MKKIVQSAKRPQAYVPDNRIATGQDKAIMKASHLDMRGWWKNVLIRNGWLDSISAFSAPMKGVPVRAYINHGRWIAGCPDKGCAGAEIVDPIDPIFMCLSCGNIENKHGGDIRFYPVSFPKDRFEIERVLLNRHVIKRNWNVGKETLNDLKRENREHGIGE